MKKVWGWLGLDDYWNWMHTHPLSFFLDLLFAGFFGMIVGAFIYVMSKVIP